jgi:hypothetical protein
MSDVLAELLQQADNDFAETCLTRHQKGEEKYGALTFLGNDTIEMAMEEVADLANYARYTWIRLWLLQRATAKLAAESPQTDHEGFVSLKELFKQ